MALTGNTVNRYCVFDAIRVEDQFTEYMVEFSDELVVAEITHFPI